MYSTKLNNNLRYVVTCITNKTQVRLIDTIVDTGAIFTCYLAEYVDTNLKESDLVNTEIKYICGFVNGSSKNTTVKIYKYTVKQFTIGNIDLGKQTIWITFDKRVTDNILGMDILRNVNFLQYVNDKELYFFNNVNELKSFVNKNNIHICRKVNKTKKVFIL